LIVPSEDTEDEMGTQPELELVVDLALAGMRAAAAVAEVVAEVVDGEAATAVEIGVETLARAHLSRAMGPCGSGGWRRFFVFIRQSGVGRERLFEISYG
jgi:hypothetical protein